jgi:predicted ATP-dependent protease
VAIEREVERSGAIHSKGVLVLNGYLTGTFGGERPLAFTASLTFEQSYDEVEGDSASCAELAVILCSLAGVPIRQDMALTGSVDQFGRVQAVGGVTEKVEGFFDICRARGLTGTQGVVVPAPNIMHLTLRPDVVDAVREGQFHIWAVDRAEEALELLTGLPAGERDPLGNYPVGTVFQRVTAVLNEMTRAVEAKETET